MATGSFWRGIVSPDTANRTRGAECAGGGAKGLFRAGPVVAAIALILPMSVVADSGAAPDRKLEQVREEIDVLQHGLGGLERRSEKEQEKLRTVEVEIGRLSRGLQLLKSKLRKQRDRLRQLEVQRRQHVAEMERQKRSLEKQVRTAYMAGHQAYLKMLFNQQKPQKLGRMLVYYDYFNRARAEQIRLLRSRLTELERLAGEIDRERSAIAALAAEREEERKALEKSKRKRGKVLAALQQEIGKGRARLDRLRRDEAELKELIARLKQKRERSPTPSPFGGRGGKGRFLWPVEGPIKAAFGSPRTRELRWKGVLIDAPEGEPVKAISAGNVVFADWLRGYGLLVIIDHGSGYMSLYGHNQSLQKEAGTRVEAGEVISTVGNSGGHMHSGLYFEIRHNGQPVDPARWCVARK